MPDLSDADSDGGDAIDAAGRLPNIDSDELDALWSSSSSSSSDPVVSQASVPSSLGSDVEMHTLTADEAALPFAHPCGDGGGSSGGHPCRVVSLAFQRPGAGRRAQG